MADLKPIVNKETTFDLLDIRLGRVISVETAAGAPKKSYRLTVDYGKFGHRVSVGRFTSHEPDELRGKLVMGVLNFEHRQIGDTVSEALILGVQLPGAESGEATIITPLKDAKIGSKLF
jgi:tRNA-binding protein